MLQTDDVKFKELMLYVATRLEDDPLFGATKLNKVLFYADFSFFALHGRSITGATYQKLNYGPAPRELLRVRAELLRANDAELRRSYHLGLVQKRLVALRGPDLSSFTREEIETVDSVLDAVRTMSGSKLSEVSHLEVGWQLAALRETIPYETVFIVDPTLTEDDILAAKKFATENGFLAA